MSRCWLHFRFFVRSLPAYSCRDGYLSHSKCKFNYQTFYHYMYQTKIAMHACPMLSLAHGWRRLFTIGNKCFRFVHSCWALIFSFCEIQLRVDIYAHQMAWPSVPLVIHFSIHTDGEYVITDGEFNSLSVRTDSIYLPMVNCFTIRTDGTDGQCFWRVILASGDAKWLIRLRALHVHRSWIHFSIQTDGFLQFSIGTDRQYLFTDGTLVIFARGLPLHLAMLNDWFTNGHFMFADREFTSPFVPMVNMS